MASKLLSKMKDKTERLCTHDGAEDRYSALYKQAADERAAYGQATLIKEQLSWQHGCLVHLAISISRLMGRIIIENLWKY
jgi:hypothetical protein